MVRQQGRNEGFARRRARMVEHDLRRRGIRDASVLDAMSRVPRHLFVPGSLARAAYRDCPLPIGAGQTISQPYIVALMSEAVRTHSSERILELGTGSGYQTAVLAEIGSEVWTIERIPEHSESARRRLDELGYTNIRFLIGDGTLGWPDEAPFDRILATGGLPSVPERLLSQLRAGGLFVGPVGPLNAQQLIRIEYHPDGTRTETLGGCRFVPLIGAAGWRDPSIGVSR